MPEATKLGQKFTIPLKLELLSGRIQVTATEEAGVRASELAIVVHELHFNRHDYMIWKEYGTVQPVFVLRSRGVPLVTVYRRSAAPLES